jgi:predicted nucleic acid-binding protein
MKVILDTNSIFTDFYLEKTNTKVFFQNYSCIPAEIYMPEVVVEEVINQYREKLYEDVQQFNENSQRLKIYFKNYKPKIITITNEVDKYRNELLKKLSEYKVNIIPFPKIEHKKIVERDLLRKKPFKRDGSGYRDTLIWETIKEICIYGTYETVFITENSKDFGTGPYVDDVLSAELFNHRIVKIVKSFKEFNEIFILPKLEKYKEIDLMFSNNQIAGVNIQNWLEKKLLDILRDYNLNGPIAGFDDDYGSVWISKINEIKDIEVDSITKTTDDKILVNINLFLDVHCSIDANEKDFRNSNSVREFFGDQDDGGSFSISSSTNQTVNTTLSLLINGSDIDSVEMKHFSGDYSSFDIL